MSGDEALRHSRVLVVGAGSIGSRHIRNLLALGADVSVYRYRQTENVRLQELGKGLRVFSSLEEALASDVEAVVIANRTDQHVPVALTAAERGLHLFIEKPLSHNLEGLGRLMTLVRERELVVEVGCMMRFHPNLLWIRDAIRQELLGKIYFCRVSAGQYLPDWRPGQDYRRSYSAAANGGGGVVLDLVHELDYLRWWFGDVQEVGAILGRLSELEITSEDVAEILLRFQCGVVAEVHLDYLRPNYRRTLEVVGSCGMVEWSDPGGVVTVERLGGREVAHKLPEGFDRNRMFLDHMRSFLDRLRLRGEGTVSIQDGIRVLQLALAAHLSSRTRMFVSPESLAC
jgi:predicted dehydrogenase